jgi:hypothetical protein
VWAFGPAPFTVLLLVPNWRQIWSLIPAEHTAKDNLHQNCLGFKDWERFASQMVWCSCTLAK